MFAGETLKKFVGLGRADYQKFSEWRSRTRPIFVGGMEKSGTTLLQGLLDGHPQIAAFPEGSIAIKVLRGTKSANADMEWMLRKGGLSNFRVDEAVWSSGRRDCTYIDFALMSSNAKAAWRHSDKSLSTLLDASVWSYGAMTGQLGKPFWAEKTPKNEQFFEQIRLAWPNSAFVVVIRDPVVNYLSYKRHSAKKKRRLDPATFSSDWLRSVSAVDQMNAQGVPCTTIFYEDLVRNPEQVMRNTATRLGIEWDEALIVPTKSGKSWDGNSSAGRKISGIQDQNRFSDRTALAHEAEKALSPSLENFAEMREAVSTAMDSICQREDAT